MVFKTEQAGSLKKLGNQIVCLLPLLNGFAEPDRTLAASKNSLMSLPKARAIRSNAAAVGFSCARSMRLI
jgi:hypothetical protein